MSLQNDLADDSNLFELRIGQHTITMTKESRKMVSEYSNGFAVPWPKVLADVVVSMQLNKQESEQ